MQMHVTFEVLPTVATPEQIKTVRAEASEAFKLLAADKRVTSTGWFIGRRGGYFVIDVNEPTEVMAIVGVLVDMFDVKIQPLGPWSAVQAMFDRDLAAKKY